jgi:hypothetical protein
MQPDDDFSELFIDEIPKKLPLLLAQSNDLSYLKEKSPLLNYRIYGNKDFEPFIQQLLDKKANPNVLKFEPFIQHLLDKKEINYTPLYFSTALSSDNIITEYLLKAGADPNAKETYPPLINTIYYGSLNTIRLLLQYGANPNIQHPNTGDTPLMKAFSPSKLFPCNEGTQLSIVRLLLAYGADLSLTNKEGKDIFHFIEKNKEIKMNKTRALEYKMAARAVLRYKIFKRQLVQLFPSPIVDLILSYENTPDNYNTIFVPKNFSHLKKKDSHE